MSGSRARATVSVIVGNEDRELNEPLFMGIGTSGCDNSQRGVSEGVSPATFASPLSVNLPVHLSGCHAALWRLTNSIYKGNTCHMYCAMSERRPCNNVANWSSILAFVQHFSSVSNYYSCSRNKEFQSILSKLSRRHSSGWQLNHAAITFVSHFD